MKNILLAAFLLFTSFGCQKKPEKPEIQHLKINFQEGDLPSLHPHDLVIYLRGLSIAKMLFEPLTRINAAGQIDFAGAKNIEISSDQLRYTFTLRDQLWSDGTEVTAYDYENSWKSVLAPESACSRADLLYCIKNAAEIKKGVLPVDALGVKALNTKTLVIDLLYPSPYFLELTAQCITVPLKDATAKVVEVFNGPFIVEEWKKGHSMRLKPNPFYWDKQNIKLDSIEIYFMEDGNTIFSSFEKNELDWIGLPLSPLSTELIHHLNKKNTLYSQAIGRSFWIFLNTQHPALQCSKIRQALSLSLDRKAITEHILLGSAPSIKPLSDHLLPASALLPIQEDLSLAKKYFDQGLKELGLTRKTFPALEISYSQQANRKQIAEYLQETWNKVLDISVILKNVEWNVLRSNLEKGLFAVSMAYEGAYYKDPLELLERYTTLNPANFSQWTYPAFVKKITEAKYEQNIEQRMFLLSESEKMLVEEMPFIPICKDCFLFSHSPRLQGYVIDSIGAIDFSRASY